MATEKKKKKSKKNKGLSVTEQNDLELKVRKYIGKGYTGLEIIEKLSLQPHVYQRYMQRITDGDRSTFEEQTSVEVYTNFVERCNESVRQLNNMQERFKYKKQFTALVAAVKMKHDINKDVIKYGQELGFIEKKGNDVSVEAEISFSTMTTEDVEREVQNEVARLNEMAGGNIIEMRPELLATLEGDEKRVKSYIPDNVGTVEEIKPIKKKITKTKVKLKLRKRS